MRGLTDSVADAALVVARWLAVVFDDADLTSARPLTDEPLRLALAQSWVMLEGDRVDVAACNRDVLAGALAEADHPASPFWPEFSGWRIIRWREVLPDFVTDAGIRGTVSGDHPEAPDVEAVWIAHVDTPVFECEPIVVQRFLVRRTVGAWRVAGIGGVLPVPGWPPTESPRL